MSRLPDRYGTTHGVRLRRARRTPGRWNWLFFPGGPGIGSESLQELVDVADCPGTSWLVDLLGDGSNVAAPGAPADPYPLWPQVLLEAVNAVPHAGVPRAERRTRFFVDDRLPRPVGVHRSGRAVDNKISYTLPEDAPFRTLVGATTVQGPRVPVDASAPIVKPPLRGPGG